MRRPNFLSPAGSRGMGAVPGSLCWKKQWQHLEGARGHCHTHGGLHSSPKNIQKASLEPVGAAAPPWGAKGTGCSSSPGNVPLITFFGTIPVPLRPLQA